jgi:hemoglobin
MEYRRLKKGKNLVWSQQFPIKYSMKKTDIEGRDGIKRLVDSFYDKVLKDEGIGFFFTDVAGINLEEHLPRMYDFWESMLFKTQSFGRNAMMPHLRLNQKESLQPEHFERWLKLFNETIDSLFSGPVADEAKHRAAGVAMSISRNTAAIQSGQIDVKALGL